MCTESVKITLFGSFCTRFYSYELWWQYRSESLRKLCVAYNNAFRLLCREPRNCSACSHMFVSRGLPTCNMLIRKSIEEHDFFIWLHNNNIYNNGCSTEIVNEQYNTGDPLETSGGLYRGPPSMLIYVNTIKCCVYILL